MNGGKRYVANASLETEKTGGGRKSTLLQRFCRCSADFVFVLLA